MAKVDQLPSEILSLILNHVRKKDLRSCALISKFFYREAMALLWRTQVIRTRRKYNAFTTTLIQSPHGQHVRSLTFCSILELYTDALEQIQDVPTLASLGNTIIDLNHIPRYCPHLTSLKMCCEPGAHLTVKATIASVGHYCKQLTRLDLVYGTYSDYDDLLDILEHTPLTHIRLFLSFKVNTQDVLRFVESAPLALHRYQQLTTLSIENLHRCNAGFISTINTHGLTWPHLTSFTLEKGSSLTDTMALTFVKAHPTLKYLYLQFGKLTDVFLDGLVDHLPNLKILNVVFNTAITAPGICRLIKNYGGRLDEVYCEGCEIEPEDVPNDKTYDFRVVEENGEYIDVGWFSGTFSDYTESDKIYKTMESFGYI